MKHQRGQIKAAGATWSIRPHNSRPNVRTKGTLGLYLCAPTATDTTPLRDRKMKHEKEILGRTGVVEEGPFCRALETQTRRDATSWRFYVIRALQPWVLHYDSVATDTPDKYLSQVESRRRGQFLTHWTNANSSTSLLFTSLTLSTQPQWPTYSPAATSTSTLTLLKTSTST
jgi:hypothetical protein